MMKNRRQSNYRGTALLCTYVLAAGVLVPAALSQVSVKLDQSGVIFVGKVVRLGAVSFSGVKPSKKTAVVHVESIIMKPAPVAMSPGQDVTVELKNPSQFKEGTEATFYTEGWILGQGVALREVGHEIAGLKGSPQPGQTERRVLESRQKQKDAALKGRMKSADMVVSGRILSVRPAPMNAGGRKIVSEHDPNWQEATISVESAMKGASAGDQIVVRFPGSEDVRFHGMPKFKADQKGLFLLARDTLTGLPKAMLGTSQVQAYVARQSADVLPQADTSRIRQLLQQK